MPLIEQDETLERKGIELIIGATAFLLAYITLVPLIGAINRTDIQNIKEMLKDLTSLSNPLSLPLNIIETLNKTFEKMKSDGFQSKRKG